MSGGPGDKGVVAAPTTLAARMAFGLTWLAGAASTLMLVVILGVVTWAVAQRYFLGQPLPWADDLSGYLLVAMIGLGMAEALRRGDHIAIDALSSLSKGWLTVVREIWSALAVLAFAILLGWSSWVQIKFAADFGSYTPGEIEIQSWIPMVPLLVGWGLLALTALGQLIEIFVRVVRR